MFTKANHIKLLIPRAALEVVFDECDRYDIDETGGRILGTYKKRGDELTIVVSGIIEPGPGAQRTRTYFMQDGAYQERVFREVEARDSSIEHLGNWHTHHVNMLRHLSDGDIQTYRRTVDHEKHNTDFFYALLVTERKKGKTGLQRYTFKNYVFQHGDWAIYEIPASALTLTDSALLWPIVAGAKSEAQAPSQRLKIRPPEGDTEVVKVNLVHDNEIVSDLYPQVKTFKSDELGIYWRGPVSLIDGSAPEVVVLQDASGKTPVFTATLRSAPGTLSRSIKALAKEEFQSCRAALIATERMCNTELFEKHSKHKRGRLWMF
jgi:integrative and conjugative element protein (TIGR02256 family)